jgi:hypothetical protein
MSFNVDWSNTLQYKQSQESGEQFLDDNGNPPSPISSVMWMMMACGMHEIYFSNACEMFARAKLYEKYFLGGFAWRMWDGNETHDVVLTPEHVLKCVGLEANVEYEYLSHWITRTCKNINQQGHHSVTEAELKKEINAWSIEANRQGREVK